ncbi:acyl-CoA dehydratase activase-related protein [Clostridium perfringens]|uniref:Putative CoA-substrate-specific enzyme activase n=1 Tax=Clostridium perfringens (strain SM101 / Type A) TaxID=289380 RepID=Q0STM0_CLOPS|nr:acyl-CoA dehydratase activase-related protein [Clostridium perfringens]ABG85803.1 putative CoA-substrate-specific enzyme activase [Clostridium perfringens SM101]MBP2861184.1 2-hydroxyglutaryl-CoA dehydratase [Clostridium perfringens]MDH5060533.1 R-phenyllactate dehydratase activator [Clostridium perfringens NCTC 8239]CAG9343582.1 CoA-substrate-specific enzyme activase [Clostridium perfringens NCTC 8239]SQB41560.1 CoA-substrate-specific enzyme activase [Clostridium perfringens]
MYYKIGIDAGSTTLKCIVLNEEDKILYSNYERHYSKVREKLIEELENIKGIIENKKFKIAITGSAGYGISKEYNLPFVQEVFATTLAIKRYYDDVDVAIELGGEDAKIIFLTGGFEERMNSSCAGGTGAFIDQMAHLMGLTVDEMDNLSLKHENIYEIASRCGVFAKTDIQPLLNQGARKEDISASVFQSVVNQTIGGLAQGRSIEGKIMFLGGPLYFCKGLRERFIKTLKLKDNDVVSPENAQVFVAIGSAIYSKEDNKKYEYEELLNIIKENHNEISTMNIIDPLFNSEEEYNEFKERHQKAEVKVSDISNYAGEAYIGIDAGSTTTKVVLMDKEDNILYEYYGSNKGNPIEVVKKELKHIYNICGEKIKIMGSAVTGYGEELIKKAFSVDFGIVETVAHYIAASHFNPKVDFILDIGGQDIKCFKIKDGIVANIMLNEACSSGCGSFIESFANQMGYDVETFSKLGLFAKHGADLGSRCTVFMNSSVKQAQKEGATVEDLSAGLSVSVVKNALYKVIRAKSLDELGKNIIVQGGTMYNDAILRAFEKELGINVIRPSISGLMGAYGCALYAKRKNLKESKIISKEDLESFTHKSKIAKCGLCTNRCNLTINIFNDGEKYISGNRCEKPTGNKKSKSIPNMYQYKYKKLREYESLDEGKRGTIGLPMVLNMYENIPLWATFFKELGFKVVLSDESNKKMYLKGQHTIPSDTVCYPAKLAHGHIENLISKNIEHIFYPCMSYNFDEGISDNCFNCPVVAYYPELLKTNVKGLNSNNFMMEYLSLNNKKLLSKQLYEILNKTFGDVKQKEVKNALEKAYIEYEKYTKHIKEKGDEFIEYAKNNNKKVIVVAGRPYHIDPEINHGIDKVLSSLGIVVLTEDSIEVSHEKQKVNILNQWTYQARLYNAAYYVAKNKDMELIQLVSFGCGTDAITSDEVKDILERNNKIYTQLKIDETNNLGAAKIRIRSLLEAIAQE